MGSNDNEEKLMQNKNESFNIIQVVEVAIKIPGVKVNRDAFLISTFDKKDKDTKKRILEVGPVEAGITKEELRKKAKTLVNNETLKSTAISFAAGLPGGIAMLGTLPADILQYFGVSLRLAQELAYLYGEEDLWEEGKLLEERVTNALVIYLGVMFGSAVAANTIRILSSKLGQQALKKIPQLALTKTFYYPIVKSVVKFFGGKMTKEIFGKTVAKVVPVIGGVVSGGITYTTLKPMGIKLMETLEKAKYSYTEEDLNVDLFELQDIIEIKKEEDIDKAMFLVKQAYDENVK